MNKREHVEFLYNVAAGVEGLTPYTFDSNAVEHLREIAWKLSQDQRAVELEPGKTYVVTADADLSAAHIERIRKDLSTHEERVGCKFVLLVGGLRIQTQEQPA